MQRDWLTTLPYTTTVYPAIFLRPLSSTPSYTLPTYLPFYLFLLCCYTFKHIYIYKCVCMCVCTRELYTSIGSFRVFFLSIFSLQPLLSIRLSSSVFVRVSILASLSLSLPPFFSAPPFLHFQSTTEQTTVPGNASISSYDPIARLRPPPSFQLASRSPRFSRVYSS